MRDGFHFQWFYACDEADNLHVDRCSWKKFCECKCKVIRVLHLSTVTQQSTVEWMCSIKHSELRNQKNQTLTPRKAVSGIPWLRVKLGLRGELESVLKKKVYIQAGNWIEVLFSRSVFAHWLLHPYSSMHLYLRKYFWRMRLIRGVSFGFIYTVI